MVFPSSFFLTLPKTRPSPFPNPHISQFFTSRIWSESGMLVLFDRRSAIWVGRKPSLKLHLLSNQASQSSTQFYKSNSQVSQSNSQTLESELLTQDRSPWWSRTVLERRQRGGVKEIGGGGENRRMVFGRMVGVFVISRVVAKGSLSRSSS